MNLDSLQANFQPQLETVSPRAMQPERPPTAQQIAIYDWTAQTTAHLAVNAVAGAGKTTTAVEAAKRAGEDVGFVAFNKHIAMELSERLNGRGEAMTLHSLGLRTLLKRWPQMNPEPDARKTERHARQLFPELFREGFGKWKGHYFLRDGWESLPEIVRVCKQQLIDPGIGPDRAERITVCCHVQGVELPDDLEETMDVASEVFRAVMHDTAAIDFDDMVSMPVYHRLVKPRFRTLFVDECQDLNPAQQELALSSGERLVVVGDPHQAIMGFAGADIRSFFTLCEQLEDDDAQARIRQLPLSCTFRCPASHVDLARHLVPHLEAKPGAPSGIAADREEGTLVREARPGDMVVCRNNAPVVRLGYRLIGEGRPVLVRGKAIGEGLAGLVRKLRADSIEELAGRLDQWHQKQLAKLDRQLASEAARSAVNDKAACLRTLIEAHDTIGELLAAIKQLFSDTNPQNRIVLSSVHRSKGLEADRVWLYEPGLMPGRGGDQELNLLYVALTRSKAELYFVDNRVRRCFPTCDWIRLAASGYGRRDLADGTA
jgi:superfamily I DNA/RNA helicase